jgi:hypothetical protein
MLRAMVALLLLANGVFFLWSQGHLALLGWVQQDPREPQRLQLQIKPEQVRLLNGQTLSPMPATPAQAHLEEPPPEPQTRDSSPSPRSAETSAAPLKSETAPASTSASESALASSRRTCWQADGFTPSQAAQLRTSLAQLNLPAGSWLLRENRSPARWLVYMGRFDNPVQLERKRTELRALQFEFRDVSTQGLTPGLSLGHYATEEAAQLALQNAQRQGIRTARVVQEHAASSSFTLRLPLALASEHKAVADLGLALEDLPLKSCN